MKIRYLEYCEEPPYLPLPIPLSTEYLPPPEIRMDRNRVKKSKESSFFPKGSAACA